MNSADDYGIYKYEPVQSDSIRLLEFPLEHDGCDLLRFGFKAYPRSNAPVYVALSYTWGEEPASAVILLEGRRFHVRPNLRACLKRMRKYGHEWRCIWVDAICINQSDDAEKNVQVSQMRKTYSEARQVVAWLGEDMNGDILLQETRREAWAALSKRMFHHPRNYVAQVVEQRSVNVAAPRIESSFRGVLFGAAKSIRT
jgi:hypothetical protein